MNRNETRTKLLGRNGERLAFCYLIFHVLLRGKNHFFYSAYLLNTDLDGGCDQHCRRPSEVYYTHRRTKLTAPETISRSSDMVVLNGSRDLTTPFSGMPYHPRASNYYTDNLPTKFEVTISTHYKDMKDDTKCRKWGGLG